mmetsp:Transcript_9410/g.22279  ORF Transcript_9410/g.22279 Transcript_9410/m.22279 type:complete len:263 (-) Transcript_9410:37-825(-)
MPCLRPSSQAWTLLLEDINNPCMPQPLERSSARARLGTEEVLVAMHSCSADGASPLQKLPHAACAQQVPAWRQRDDRGSLQAHHALVEKVGPGLTASSTFCTRQGEVHGKSDSLDSAQAVEIIRGAAARVAPVRVLVCHGELLPVHPNSDCDVLTHGGFGMTAKRIHELPHQVVPIDVMGQTLKHWTVIQASRLATQGRLLALLLELLDGVHGCLVVPGCLSTKPRAIRSSPQLRTAQPRKERHHCEGGLQQPVLVGCEKRL